MEFNIYFVAGAIGFGMCIIRAVAVYQNEEMEMQDKSHKFNQMMQDRQNEFHKNLHSNPPSPFGMDDARH